jgi:cytidylate kinase
LETPAEGPGPQAVLGNLDKCFIATSFLKLICYKLLKSVIIPFMNLNSSLFPVITIDGPCGAGKGEISQRLAQEKGWHLLESGAIYRILALVAKRAEVASDDVDHLTHLADSLNVQFIVTPDNRIDVLLDGESVGDAIRTQEISNLASKISVFPQVRKALFARQRTFRKAPGLIAEGRDMGTVVFPDAQVKIFLTASLEERAKRRYQQLLEKGMAVKLSDLVEELSERDVRDQQRKTAPMQAAEDAVTIDTTLLTIDQVMDRIREVVNKKLGG